MSYPYLINAEQVKELPVWMSENADKVNRLLDQHSAVLLRGFDVTDAALFEQAMTHLCPDLLADNGEHNRESLSNKIYTPIFYPETEKSKMA